MQVQAAVTRRFGYARSAEFLQQPLMQTLVWLRMPGDIIFAAGAGMLAPFVAKPCIGKAKRVPETRLPVPVEPDRSTLP